MERDFGISPTTYDNSPSDLLNLRDSEAVYDNKSGSQGNHNIYFNIENFRIDGIGITDLFDITLPLVIT